MSFFVQPSVNTLMTAITDPETLRQARPGYYEPRFAAIAELRSMDDGTLHKGNEFRRVASLVNVPLLTALKILEPEFLKDKRKFYQWLDSGNNKLYATYDRRKQSLPSQLTFVDGKAVI